MVIQLPAKVSEGGFGDFLDLLGAANGAARIEFDLASVSFLIPAAIVAITTKVARWRSEGREVVFMTPERCPSYRYLQRFNFFSMCGLALPEYFERHDPGHRFVPVAAIGRGFGRDVGALSTLAARCIAPECDTDDPETSGFYDLFEYSVSEMASNVVQHSEGAGHLAAQYTPKSGFARLAIADCGIGILDSFKKSASPVWFEGMTHAQAINEALKPKVSSKIHLGTVWGASVNAGVGLTMLKEITSQLGGVFLLASGNSVLSSFGSGLTQQELRGGADLAGTICALRISRTSFTSFFEVLHNAKTKLGLLPGSQNLNNLFS